MRAWLLQITPTRRRALSALIRLALSLCALPALASAQQLSIRHYGVSEGMANDRVVAIHQDAKGYVWFATYEGLSRFDGYRFVNYSRRNGLGHSVINDIVEDSHGRLWVATNGGGVSLLLDRPLETETLSPAESTMLGPKFVSFRVADTAAANRVNKLVFDAAGNLWCGTDDGLFRAAADSVTASAPRFERLLAEAEVGTAGMSGAASLDREGRLWFGVRNGIIEVNGGRILRHAGEPFKHGAMAMAEDGRGRFFAATDAGVLEFIAPAMAAERGGWRRLPLHLKSGNGIVTIAAGEAGTLWVGTSQGLVKYRDRQQSLYGAAQGLSDERVRSLCQDRDGNLWIGTWEGGVFKLAGEMILSFTKTEGLVSDNVSKIVEGRDGRIIASFEHSGLVQLVGGKAIPIQKSRKAPFNHTQHRILQSRDGQWWIATGAAASDGVYRFRESPLQLRRGKRLLSTDEIHEGWFSAIYEDPEGNIWVAAGGHLYRFAPRRRAPPFFERIALQLPPAEPLQPETPVRHVVQTIIGDRAGALWLGDLYLLARYANGKLTVLQPTEGLPETDPRSFFIDHRGWLWIGLRYRGVSMTTEPAAEHPRFVNYSTQTGLTSDTVWSITEDDSGRMYFGTGRGLDRLDVASGHIRHFTTADGLAGAHVNCCMKDSQGYIWVATTTGVSRLDPRAEPVTRQAPPVYLRHVQIAGEDLPLAETGASLVRPSDLPASHNNLLIQYTAIDFHDDHQLRYQYELEGVDPDWSEPTEQMAVNYARLAPGEYRFLVRAINEAGIASPQPAVLQFRILPPLWQRWWFVSGSIVMAGLMLYAVYRYRVARLIELERMRTRIASDLHDDIGANLSLLAGLSEMLKQQAGARDTAAISDKLSLMAAVSRRSVDAMSDIVWAVNPNKDYLRDLVQRMRRFASDAFTARNVDLHFSAPALVQDLKLSAETRREVFLVFKEAVNNAARHSDCTRAEVLLAVERGWLTLEVRDNGRGFDLGRLDGGEGIVSMRQRASKLGGTLTVISASDAGTSVLLKAPLR